MPSPMTPEALASLTTPAGERLLAQLASEDLSDAAALRLLTRLRRDHPADQASAALELARLRAAAVPKFGAAAARMFFTRDALEQASDPLVRRWRARGAAGTLADVCCGIGADALAFAVAGADVLGIDHDALRVAMARLNAAALGLPARFEVVDARTFVPAAESIFYDPARRTAGGRRIHAVEAYEPPLSLVRSWDAPRMAVKLSPGVDLAELEPYLQAGWSLDFVSADGELKEALLRRGTHAGGLLRAVLLTADAEHALDTGALAGLDAVALSPREPRAWLCEPDPAILRAGLVEAVAAACGGSLLDETIAYFTTDAPPQSPWVRAWRIEAWLPFSVKRLRDALRERGVGRVTVKKRGTAVTPEALMPQLKLRGDAERVLVLTRLRGQQIALVCAAQSA